nr:MAG TPA: hypothetical protein [Caudoviricetes sp.]
MFIKPFNPYLKPANRRLYYLWKSFRLIIKI